MSSRRLRRISMMAVIAAGLGAGGCGGSSSSGGGTTPAAVAADSAYTGSFTPQGGATAAVIGAINAGGGFFADAQGDVFLVPAIPVSGTLAGNLTAYPPHGGGAAQTYALTGTASGASAGTISGSYSGSGASGTIVLRSEPTTAPSLSAMAGRYNGFYLGTSLATAGALAGVSVTLTASGQITGADNLGCSLAGNLTAGTQSGDPLLTVALTSNGTNCAGALSGLAFVSGSDLTGAFNYATGTYLYLGGSNAQGAYVAELQLSSSGGASATADLAVTGTVDNGVPAMGDTVNYTFTVTAQGPADSTSVTVTDLLPAELTYDSSIPSTGTYDPTTGVWTVGNISASTSQTLTITATVSGARPSEVVVNTATAAEASTLTDPNPANNTAIVRLTVAAGTATVNNVLPIAVNNGPTGNYPNGVFADVTVCVPGTTNCATIHDVLVDTGSYGLRLLASAVPSSLSLPLEMGSDGNPIGECTQYAASFTWGPVATADVQLAGETAAAAPIQMLGVSNFPSAPAACTNSGLTESDTQTTLGANGILGIGPFRYDCGGGCDSAPAAAVYFSCPSNACLQSQDSIGDALGEVVPLAQQVQNPVWLFPQDNNGLLVSLPAITVSPDTGVASAGGTVTFGIGTQSDNALGSAAILTADPTTGGFQTWFQGTTFPGTIFDTGSNANFFLTSSLVAGLQDCSDNAGFYCPSATLSFSATNQGVSPLPGKSVIYTAPAQWTTANADTLFSAHPGYAAFDNLGGPNGTSSNTGFDFGLPFFFGRTIFVGINGMSVGSGVNSIPGPFFAY